MSTAPASGRAISSGRQLTVTATPSGGTRIYLQQQTPSTSAASSSGGHRPNLPPQQRQTSGQSSRPSGATATASSIPVVFTAASPATKPGGSTTQGQGNPPGHRPLIPFDPDKEIKQFWPKQREKVDALTTMLRTPSEYFYQKGSVRENIACVWMLRYWKKAVMYDQIITAAGRNISGVRSSATVPTPTTSTHYGHARPQKGELRDANKAQLLPLARIKKIMKIDDDVKSQMISAEAPVLFAKACEIFIEELTLRAWVHTEDNKRKTLQKNDIAMAIAKYEQFDFLIDIVPREESKTPTTKRQPEPDLSLLTQITGNASSADPTNQVQQYYISVPGGGGGQVSLQALGTGGSSGLLQTMGSHQVQLQNGQVVQATPIGQPIQLQAVPGQTMQLIAAGDVLGGTAGQPIQLQVLPSGVQIAETGEIQTVEDEDMVDREELE